MLGSNFLVANAQFRDVEVEYRLLSPSKGDSFKSPGMIPVYFRLFNNGPDTIYSADSFVYSITHGLIYPFKPVTKRLTVGEVIVPGDSSSIYYDSVPIDWEGQFVPTFELSILASYFTSLRPGEVFRVTHPDYQDSIRKVTLRHIYNSSTPFEDTHTKLKYYPNPNNGYVHIELGENLSSENLSINMYNITGQPVDFSIENYSTNHLILHYPNCRSGIYFLQIKEGKDVLTNSRILIIN